MGDDQTESDGGDSEDGQRHHQLEHENPIEVLSEFMERVIKLIVGDLIGLFNQTPRVPMDNLRPILESDKSNNQKLNLSIDRMHKA